MPCSFTGPKIFCAGPNFWSQPINLTAFSASSKNFVPAQKPILLNANHLFIWHKMFVTVTIQGPPTQIDTFQTNIFSWLDDIMIKKKIFLKSSDREIWYKSFNLGIHIFLWLQSLHIWKIQRVVFLIFVDIFKWKWKQKQCSLLPLINFWQNQC